MNRRSVKWVTALCILIGAVAVVSIITGWSRGEESAERFTGTVLCEPGTATVVFSPTRGRIEVRVGKRTVAWGDTAGRGLTYETCQKARAQRGWYVGIPYTTTQDRALLTCRFRGPFYVHVLPSYDHGQEAVSGSSVLLVVPRRGALARRMQTAWTLIAFAMVDRRQGESYASFWHRRCTRR